jgi:hypothetical protein
MLGMDRKVQEFRFLSQVAKTDEADHSAHGGLMGFHDKTMAVGIEDLAEKHLSCPRHQ